MSTAAVYARSMTEPTRDPDVEAFLAVGAARLAPRTVDAYRRDLEALVAWLGRPAGSATRDDLERYLAQLRADGLAGSTIARRLAAVRSLFRHQLLIGARDDNPAVEIESPRRPRRLPRTLSPGEAERLVQAAAGTTPRSLRDHALVELLYGAGLRVSEAVGLERGGVDLDERLVRSLGKGGKERVVPIGRSAAAAGREGRARAGPRAPSPATALFRHAPARRGRRPPQRPGDARARRPRHDRAVHARDRPAPPRFLLRGSSPRTPKAQGFR